MVVTGVVSGVGSLQYTFSQQGRLRGVEQPDSKMLLA
jgi:hypothetical protein